MAGFRPGAPRDRRCGPGVASFQAPAEVVEYLGNEELLHLTLDDQRRRGDRRLVAQRATGRRPDAASSRSTSFTCSTARPALTLAPRCRGDRRLSGHPSNAPTRRPPERIRCRRRRSRERVVASEMLHQGRLPDVSGRHHRARRRLERDTRRSRATRARSRSSPSTTTIGSCSSGSIGWPSASSLLEIPAGTLDVADRRVDRGPRRGGAARARGGDRDAGPASWRKLARFWTAPGFASELMHLYLATDLRPARRRTAHARRGRAAIGRADVVARRGRGRRTRRDPRRQDDRRPALAGRASERLGRAARPRLNRVASAHPDRGRFRAERDRESQMRASLARRPSRFRLWPSAKWP